MADVVLCLPPKQGWAGHGDGTAMVRGTVLTFSCDMCARAEVMEIIMKAAEKLNGGL